MAHAKTSLRAEQRALRDRMRAAGMSQQQIAVEFACRYGLRPRAAWRHSYGWSQTEAAEHINRRAADTGLDSSGTAAMTGPHLCEYENWPGQGPKPSGRRPTPLVLSLLAAAYCTPAIHDLLDFADYQNMPAPDRLVLNATVHAKSQAGNDTQPARQASRRSARAHAVTIRTPHHGPRPPRLLPVPGCGTPARDIPPVLAPLATALLQAPQADAGEHVVLADEAIRIWRLRQAARYRELATGLPNALTRARGREAEPDARRSPTGLAALAHLYNAASSLAKNFGSFELAGIAADRAVRTADRTGDPLLAGAAAYRLANVLLSAGHNASTRAIAVSAADRLRPVLTATASHTATWGALLATAAQAAGREHAGTEAWELLGASKVAADLLACEHADLFSVFGPASWLIHAVNIAADLGDGIEATRRAAQIPAGHLPPLLAERRAFLLLGKARGHALRADLTAAAETLLEAEQAAPEEFRHNSEARTLVFQLLSASPRPSTLLRELAAKASGEAALTGTDGTSR